MAKCREAEYQGQHAAERTPTLPVTGDGKINVRATARAIGLQETQEKYLYEREELFCMINAVAEAQGLLPIGARLAAQGDDAIRSRMAQIAKGAKRDAQAAVEARASETRLLEELKGAWAEIERLKLQCASLKEQLDLFRHGVCVELE